VKIEKGAKKASSGQLREKLISSRETTMKTIKRKQQIIIFLIYSFSSLICGENFPFFQFRTILTITSARVDIFQSGFRILICYD